MNNAESVLNFEDVVKNEWTSDTTVDAWRKWADKLAIHTQALTNAVVEHAQLSPGLSVLDLASGAGEPSLTIAKQLQSEGTVVATDLSESMLTIAKDKARKAGINNIQFQTADAHDLPFDDDSFDRVVSRLGIMYFWDVDTALAEIYRVLKPSGIASFVVWGPIERNTFLASLLGPFMKRREMPAPPPDAPTPMRFADIAKLTQVFSQAGFNQIDAKEYVDEMPWPGTPLELFDHVYDVAVPLQTYFDSFDMQDRKIALAEIEEDLNRGWDGSFTRANGAFNAITAMK